MRAVRTIVIPAILALAAAGSILGGSVAPAAAAQAPAVHMSSTTSHASPDIWYQG